MTLYFISGTNTGLGSALVAHLQKNSDNTIVGLNRRSDPRITNVPIDLGNSAEVEAFDFAKAYTGPSPDRVVLINNAAWIGPLKPISQQSSADVIRVMNTNLVSPIILSNKFFQHFQSSATTIVVQVSGASWGNADLELMSLYCASKAGLSRFGALSASESRYMFTVLPGGLDSAMQAEIRSIESAVQQSHEQLHASGGLRDPAIIAEKLLEVVARPDHFEALINIPQLFDL